ILENLNERGFHIENGTLDMEHCFVALQTLAKFHAFYFQMIHEKKQLEPEYSILKEYPNFFQEVVLELETENGKQWFQYTVDSVKCILNGMPTSNSKIESKIVEKLYALCEYLKPVENQYNVISHGDLWTNNIMFSSENGSPKNCCFIDYQLLRFLPLGNDVLTLLHLNTSPEFRR
ncbi:uncharacterized protein LOC123306024, partial [Chrysoperla carnea]|uniref:uncharacterized protein LOC123306024 n=1 Tax=Chrysoperla carnea TaxID=189513 RepID=UPI001D069BDF